MTSPVVVELNSYVTLAEASAYLGDSLRGQTWIATDPDTQAQALIAAQRNFQKQRWLGIKTGDQVLATLTVATGGTGYAVGDVLVVAGGTTLAPARATVLTAPGGVVATVQVLDEGLYTVLPSSPAATTGGSGSGCTLNLVASAQSLAFPRSGLTDLDGNSLPQDAVPQQVRDAQCEYAMDMVLDAAVETASGTGSNLRVAKAGPAEVEFFRPTDGPGRNQRFSTIVLELLKPFLAGSNQALSIATGTDQTSEFEANDTYGFSQGLP